MNQPFLLVTGFGSFEAVTENPSGQLAKRLNERPDVVGIELPVSFERAPSAMANALASLPATPAGVLSLGVHPGHEFRLERRARAELDAERTDVDGGVGASLAWTGPDLECDLDLDVLVADLELNGAVNPRVSEDAGRYVCECIYRCGLTHGRELGVPALFLHVPPLESMPVDVQLPLVERVVEGMLSQTQARG